ncbi:MAG: glutathionylspermidine synthase family protein [Desulfobacteraceae bacterium]|nr:glutathionylspermidine synthase family protein [Desulfobacteraceae bacterium]
MKRVSIEPREHWKHKVEETGLLFFETPEGPWWDESAYYEFDSEEIDELDAAAEELHELCLRAVQHVIDHNRFEELAIPPPAIPLIRESWEKREPSLYGRFDFAYDGANPPKMLEYNADTPTSLLEAAVTQWFWLQELFPQADQFNSIHEKLEAGWRHFARLKREGGKIHFCCVSDHLEDLVTVTYLQDTAQSQGFLTDRILMEEIGWDYRSHRFADLHNITIENIFKLYPWEWILDEQFGPHVLETYTDMCWIEPIWKMILSNKGILPILWELNPEHPNLLEAYMDTPRSMKNYVRKPKLSREGANISIFHEGREIHTPGTYGEGGYVCQALADIPCFDGNRPVFGCWIVDGQSAGLGIRETSGPVTFGNDRFVPHLFR